MKKTYTVTIELELDTDEEGITDKGWLVATQFQEAIEKLRDDYGWSEIKQIGNPKSKPSN